MYFIISLALCNLFDDGELNFQGNRIVYIQILVKYPYCIKAVYFVSSVRYLLLNIIIYACLQKKKEPSSIIKHHITHYSTSKDFKRFQNNVTLPIVM